MTLEHTSRGRGSPCSSSSSSSSSASSASSAFGSVAAAISGAANEGRQLAVNAAATVGAVHATARGRGAIAAAAPRSDEGGEARVSARRAAWLGGTHGGEAREGSNTSVSTTDWNLALHLCVYLSVCGAGYCAW